MSATSIRSGRVARNLLVTAVAVVMALALTQAGGASQALAATTFTVNTVDDLDLGACTAAHCSLREAINAANVSAGADSIVFNIAGPSPHTIQPTSPLPDITGPVNIDGGSSPNCGGTPAIELSGALSGGNGLQIRAGPSTVRGLVINGFNAAIFLSGNGVSGSGANVVQCSYLGTDVSGTSARPNFGFGVEIQSANNLIGGTTAATRNVISGNSDAGVRIEDNGIGVITNLATGNVVSGNYIGTNVTGTAALGNHFQGVFINGPSGNTVGGTAPGAGNVIAGNQGAGIAIGSNGATIQGNYIGTDATGSVALGNSNQGILITGSNNIVGGSGAGSRNTISGNQQIGVEITITGGSLVETGNVVRGNYIGTNASGTASVPNASWGVLLIGGVGGTLSGNFIGGAGSGDGNLISGNANVGVQLEHTSGNTVQGNLIGVKSDGASALGNSGDGIRFTDSASSNTVGGTAGGANTIAFNGGNGVSLSTFGGTCCSVSDAIEGNSIFSNIGLGIDLAADGVTPNDSGDSDAGPNNLQNFPVLTVTPANGASTVQGTLNSQANTTFRIEFFSSPSCDPSGFGEGQTYLGTLNATTDSSGNASFSSGFTLSANSVVTATATDPAGNTSEFAACASAPAPTTVDLAVSLVASPNPVTVRTHLTYTIGVVNNPPSVTASGVLVSDTLPAHSSLVSVNASQGTCTTNRSRGVTTVMCDLGSLASGASASITLVVSPGQVGTIVDTATVSSTTIDRNPANNSATQSTTVVK